MERNIPNQALKRLPLYLEYLDRISSDYISTPMIAKALGLTEILVKKDLSYVLSNKGKPKVGHRVSELKSDILRTLGCLKPVNAILIGVGSLGKALIGYSGFSKWNVEIIKAFDIKKTPDICGVEVLDVEMMTSFITNNKVELAIITTPANVASSIAKTLIDNNIKAIWNFAPIELIGNSIIKNENLGASLAVIIANLNENK